MTNPSPAGTGNDEASDKALQSVTMQVRKLLENGKCKQAVEAAKTAHKQLGSAASEELLVRAYIERIKQFQSRGAVEDANTLVQLVRQRFPSHAGRLAALQHRSEAAAGNIAPLVAPLARAETPPEVREEIEKALRQELVDPRQLAECATLPTDHPLRAAARAVWRALAIVTTGPVTDENQASVELPEVSHRSPLAPWKLLIRAIAAFHHNDDDACRRFLAAIAHDAAAARLVPVLLAMIEMRPPAGGAPATLYNRVVESGKQLHNAIEEVITSVDSGYYRLGFAKAAIAACEKSRADLVPALRRLLVVISRVKHCTRRAITEAIGSVSEDAEYWRLMAKELEDYPDAARAAAGAAWLMFLERGSRGNLFPRGGLEEAAILRRVIDIMLTCEVGIDEDIVDDGCAFVLEDAFGDHDFAADLSERELKNLFESAADVDRLFYRITNIAPDTATFELWTHKLMEEDAEDAKVRATAELWEQKLPNDPRASLLLAELAEGRKALKQALKHVNRAYALDPMNPLVRRALTRLTLETIWRHLRERKTKLVEDGLAKLSSMPNFMAGDAAWLPEAIRVILLAWQNRQDEARDTFNTLATNAGLIFAKALVGAVAASADVHKEIRIPTEAIYGAPNEREAIDDLAFARDVARFLTLAMDLKLNIIWAGEWTPRLLSLLKRRPSPLSTQELLAIGKAFTTGAQQTMDADCAYQASGAVLANATGLVAARALLIRAASIPRYAVMRIRQCIRASETLARQSNDRELLDDLFNFKSRQFIMGSSNEPLRDELVRQIIQKECEAAELPENAKEANRYVVTLESEEEQEERPWFVDDEDDENSFDEFDMSELPMLDDESSPSETQAAMDLLFQKVLDSAGDLRQRIERKHGKMRTISDLRRVDRNLATELIARFQEVENLAFSPENGPKNRRRRRHR